jgi:hypothetical protein
MPRQKTNWQPAETKGHSRGMRDGRWAINLQPDAPISREQKQKNGTNHGFIGAISLRPPQPWLRVFVSQNSITSIHQQNSFL